MAKDYPCDCGECPYGGGNRMYFCRDHCGLGVDEDSYPDEDIEAELQAEHESLGNNWW